MDQKLKQFWKFIGINLDYQKIIIIFDMGNEEKKLVRLSQEHTGELSDHVLILPLKIANIYITGSASIT